MSNAIKNFFLFLVSILICLILGEVWARTALTVRSVGPSFTKYDPIYGRWHKKLYQGKKYTPEFVMNFSTNSFGFRGAEPNSFPVNSILFLGDYFSEGFGVNDGEEFPERVRKWLHDIEKKHQTPVVNAGMGNNGNGLWIKFLTREGARYNPSLIVLQILSNDFDNNINEQKYKFDKKEKLIELPSIKKKFFNYVQEIIEYIPGLSYSHLVGYARLSAYAAVRKSNSINKKAIDNKYELTYAIIEKILKICKTNGWPILVISIGIEPKYEPALFTQGA